MVTKFKDIQGGSVVNPLTDQILAVRDGQFDRLVILGSASALAASDATMAYLASVKSSTILGNIAVFDDVSGTIKDGGTLAAVALSGSYTDLSNRPSLGSAAALNAGSANGVATLDSGGKIPIGQIPASIISGIQFAGLWNAFTNTPALTSSVGVSGTFYKVSVSGTTNLDGINEWYAGEYALFDGSVWGKIDGLSAEVLSVAGRTGNVVLAYADISGLGTAAQQNVAYFATAAQGTKADTALQTGSVATVALTGDYNDLINKPTIITTSQVNAFTKQQYAAAAALTAGTTVAWNLDNAQAATLTPAQNFTLSNPTNQHAGATYTLIVTQDGTGTRVITWGSVYKFAGGTKFVLSTAANAVDIISFMSDGTNMYAVGQSNFL